MGEGPEAAGCRTCRGPVPPGSAHCYCCSMLVRQIGVPLVPVVAIAPYRVGDDLHHLLRGYKDAPVVDQRRAHVAALARLVRRWWTTAGGQQAGAAGPDRRGASGGTRAGPFVGWSAIATVPSSGRRPRPAVDAIVDMVPELARRPRYRLVRGPAATGHLVASPRGFELAAGGPQTGRSQTGRSQTGRSQADRRSDAPARPVGPAGAHRAAALVVDDTWTTGARAQSVAAALRRAGVPVVGVLVIGRCLDPTASPWHAAYWGATAAQRTWARAACLPARR